MIRLFDIILSLFGLIILFPILIILLIICFLDTGSPIFYQERMGLNMKPFSVLKFRSMDINTKSQATHLTSSDSITSFGRFLRKSKLDELPQLLNVFIGNMSLVGPRPNLYNQNELIHERTIRGIYKIKPGITGLAQINKIDMSEPMRLAETDLFMIEKLDLRHYFLIILQTLMGRGSGDRINNI